MLKQNISNSLIITETEKPYLAKSQVGRYPEKEGKNLPNSIEEDIGSISLSPIYSDRQLRNIKRRSWIAKSSTSLNRKTITYKKNPSRYSKLKTNLVEEDN
jgi:hypothetical protein